MKVIVQNIVTEYEDSGNNRPVVLFLHGWGSSLHTFDTVAPLLVDKFRILRLDMPGFGKTGFPTAVWGVGEYATFVKDFMEKLGINDYFLVGHSLGGRIILKGQATLILKASKIVLVASAGVAKRKTFRNTIFKVVAKIGNIVSFIPPFYFWRKNLKSILYKKVGSDYINSGFLKETFIKIIGEDLSSFAKNINTPTLLIWGSNDQTTPLSEGQYLNTLIRNSTLKIMNNSGHFVHEENPKEVADLIKSFI